MCSWRSARPPETYLFTRTPRRSPCGRMAAGRSRLLAGPFHIRAPLKELTTIRGRQPITLPVRETQARFRGPLFCPMPWLLALGCPSRQTGQRAMTAGRGITAGLGMDQPRLEGLPDQRSTPAERKVRAGPWETGLGLAWAASCQRYPSPPKRMPRPMHVRFSPHPAKGFWAGLRPRYSPLERSACILIPTNSPAASQ